MPKKTTDEGRRLTDIELAELEKRIREVYASAEQELKNTIDEHFAKLDAKDKEMKRRLEAGEITQEQYLQWRLAYIGRGRRFEELRDKLAERVTHANEVATAYVNDKSPTIYTLNRNYAAYSVEKSTGFKYHSFTLINEATVRRLIVEQPDLMPYYPQKLAVKRGIDLEYGRKQITASVTSGILQGKSTSKIAADLRQRIVSMSVESALRTARTAVTAAENGGREDTYTRAAELGIDVKYQWMATLDARTRPAHGHADGQVRNAGELFDVGGEKLLFPGDRAHGASGWNIYNCRCLKTTWDKYSEKDPGKRRARNPRTGEWEIIDYKTFDKWQAEEQKKDPEAFAIARKKVKNESADKKLFEKYRAEFKTSAPQSLAELQEMKYNKSDEWSFFKAFANERRKGYISDKTSIRKLRSVYNDAVDMLVGQTTSNGIEIKSVSVHFAARVIGNPGENRKGVSLEKCLEALTTPVRVDPITKVNDEYSQRFWTIGTTVTVNPYTGKAIQANPNHRKKG